MSRLIDVDATIPMIKYATTDNEIGVFPIKIGYDDIVKVLNAQPTVDAEPVRHGYWIRKEWAEESEGLLIDNYECSACKGWVRNETNYCPNCGAKMDVERKEE